MSEKCSVCHSVRHVEINGEIICEKCGFVFGLSDDILGAAPVSAVPTSANEIGSGNLVDKKLNLSNLNPKMTQRMMEKKDRYLVDFTLCCESLKLPKFVTDAAFILFTKLRKYKLGVGKTAVFCIYHSCLVSEHLCDSDSIIETVRSRFCLRRRIKISAAIYDVKPTAIEHGLVGQSNRISDSFAILKNVDPEHHRKAAALLPVFTPGDSAGSSGAKNLQEYMECYD